MLTNKYNLPEVIVKAASQDHYVASGDISVTSLIDSPKIRVYKRMYRGKIEKDVSEMLMAIEGTALHHILELADVYNADAKKMYRAYETLDNVIAELNAKKDRENYKKAIQVKEMLGDILASAFPHFRKYVMTEEIMHVDIKGWMLKGQFDRLEIDKRKLIDFKKVSVWSYANKYESEQHNLQQNIYRWMIKKTFDIDVAQSVLIRWYRDWQKSKAATMPSSSYPPQRVQEVEVPLMSYREIEEYVSERIDLHQRVEREGPESYQCTPQEKWQGASEWKVYNADPEKQKRALTSPFYRENDALKWQLENEHKYPLGVIVKKVEGENRRCLEYCEFRNFCKQYHEENNA